MIWCSLKILAFWLVLNVKRKYIFKILSLNNYNYLLSKEKTQQLYDLQFHLKISSDWNFKKHLHSSFWWLCKWYILKDTNQIKKCLTYRHWKAEFSQLFEFVWCPTVNDANKVFSEFSNSFKFFSFCPSKACK